MAQHDYNIANASFPTVRTDINNVLSAINSSNSGSSRPSSAVAGTIWLDTSGAATAQLLKMYDGAADITLGTINFTANTVDWTDSSVIVSDNSVTLAKMASGTDGNIISYDASGDPVAVATGNSGQVLTSAGAGAVPSFQTLTGNATHSGEVTGSGALTIADNVVDEANLKVSNSPSNGYFLSAQSGNSGGLTWAEVGGGGKVLQVLQTTSTSTDSTNSANFTNTSLSGAITPSASNSKVLIMVTGSAKSTDSGANAVYTLSVGTTNLINSSSVTGMTQLQLPADNVINTPLAMQFLHAPSTTSATTYRVQHRSTASNGNSVFGESNHMSSMILMEIGA